MHQSPPPLPPHAHPHPPIPFRFLFLPNLICSQQLNQNFKPLGARSNFLIGLHIKNLKHLQPYHRTKSQGKRLVHNTINCKNTTKSKYSIISTPQCLKSTHLQLGKSTLRQILDDVHSLHDKNFPSYVSQPVFSVQVHFWWDSWPNHKYMSVSPLGHTIIHVLEHLYILQARNTKTCITCSWRSAEWPILLHSWNVHQPKPSQGKGRERIWKKWRWMDWEGWK